MHSIRGLFFDKYVVRKDANSVKRSEYIYGNSNKLLKLVEKMKDASGMELLQKIATFRYDNNGNELRRSVECVSLFNKANPKAYEAAVYSNDSTEPIHAVVDQTVSKYDGFNRLVRTELIKATVKTVVEYAYDGDGLRTEKTVRRSDKGNTPEVTSYLYDRQHVILETRGNDSIRYARGINYIGRIDNAGTLSYFLFNGHGDVTQTVSEAGEIENQYDYDIFGNPTLTVENYLNSIRYAGEFYDAETGLYYLRARFYDPYVGRFISEDSYWGEDNNPLSLNLYTYCYNDPIKFVDPTGHWGGVAGERDDTKLSREDQQKIKELTDKYFSTKDKSERDKIHEAAEKIRDEAAKRGDISKDNSDSFGKAANEKIKEDREKKGRSYMSDKEWRDLSQEHDRRSGGVSKRDESKTIEKEIKEITERKEKSSDYKIGSKGYIEDVEKISIKSGAKKALEFVQSDVRQYADELKRISDKKRETYSDMLSSLAKQAQLEKLDITDPIENAVYVFYLPDWEKEAKDDRKRLAAYYGLEENQIILTPVTNADELTKTWNNMGTIDGKKVNIAAVIINTHANSNLLAFSNKPTKDEQWFDSDDISKLESKDVGKLILYGCNAGHIDNKENNPAAGFAKKVEGGPVLASDGTDYSSKRILWLFGPMQYESKNDKHFKNQRAEGSTRDNEGWITYKYKDDKITTSDSLGKKLTLTQMLQKLK